jgi:very-short-patch-repair endonuclease
MPPTEREIGEVAGRQDNVIARAQLFALGVPPRVIERRLENGRWRCLHRGIYLIGPAPPALPARARAAALACGDGAVVSHRTAAELWGLLPPELESGDAHVTVCERNPGTRSGIHTHRVRRLPEEEVTIRHGIPLTTPARTICDLAATEPLRDVESALAEARIHRLATDRQINAVIHRAPTRPGAPIIRTLLEQEDDSGYTRSKAERLLRDLIAKANLERPLFNEPLLGYVVDALWPQQRLIVEVDGYTYHSHRAAFERDRARDQQLTAAGYRVIRITWIQLRDRPIETITAIVKALAQH